MASNLLESCIELTPERDWATVAPARLTVGEEVVNSVTHGLGFLMSLAATPLLMGEALRNRNTAVTVACGVYLFSLIGVYGMSFLSHACHHPRQRRLFRSLDQAFIYCLIAGTYTPFAMAYLSAAWYPLTAAMWTIAIAGFCSKVFAHHRVESVSIPLYMLMGWLPIISLPTLLPSLSTQGLQWVLLGGLAYTIGTVFLALDRRYRYFHAVWHLLVIAGSLAHYMTILRDVVPHS